MLDGALGEFEPADDFGVEHGSGEEEGEVDEKGPRDVVGGTEGEPTAVGKHGADGETEIAEPVMAAQMIVRGGLPGGEQGFQARSRSGKYIQTTPLCHCAATASEL